MNEDGPIKTEHMAMYVSGGTFSQLESAGDEGLNDYDYFSKQREHLWGLCGVMLERCISLRGGDHLQVIN